MKTGKYFHISELIYSPLALQNKIDNTPPPTVKVKLAALITNCLDPIREKWGKPIIVNSGFRSPTLNNQVGGKPNSQHIQGEAADITTGSEEDNQKLFELIKKSDIPFDQLIDEKDYKWLHISWKANGNRKQAFHL